MRTLIGAVLLFAGTLFAQSDVTYISGDKVKAGFEKGGVLLNKGAYQVHTSRRGEPGKAEVHADDTDVFYILTGTATLVTGGKTVGASTTGPGEIRGDGIEDGTSRVVHAGDVIVIPNGTPHWFKEVPGPMTYYTVKVRACGK